MDAFVFGACLCHLPRHLFGYVLCFPLFCRPCLSLSLVLPFDRCCCSSLLTLALLSWFLCCRFCRVSFFLCRVVCRWSWSIRLCPRPFPSSCLGLCPVSVFCPVSFFCLCPSQILFDLLPRPRMLPPILVSLQPPTPTPPMILQIEDETCCHRFQAHRR